MERVPVVAVIDHSQRPGVKTRDTVYTIMALALEIVAKHSGWGIYLDPKLRAHKRLALMHVAEHISPDIDEAPHIDATIIMTDDDRTGTGLMLMMDGPAGPVAEAAMASRRPIGAQPGIVADRILRFLRQVDPRAHDAALASITIAVELAVDSICRLIEQLEAVRRDNAELRVRCEQLESLRDALAAELRSANGPRRATAGPIARAAGAVVLSIIGGAAGGIAQAHATPESPPVSVSVTVDVAQAAADACAHVVSVVDP